MNLSKVSWKQQMKDEFYQDFLDIYWADEFNNGCSDTPMCYQRHKYKKEQNTLYNNYEEDDYMKITRKVQLVTYKDIKDFVSIATKYGDILKIKGQKCKFPACSLISVLSLLDLEKPIKIEFYEETLVDVEHDFKKWMID